MRTRDPVHVTEMNQIAALPEHELLRRIRLRHTEPQHISSEVLAAMVRSHLRRTKGIAEAAVAMLNDRIQLIVGARWRGAKDRHEVQRRGNQAFADAIDYVWMQFFEDKSPVSNAEVRFGVFVRDRLDDFLRHLRTEANSMDSVDGMESEEQETSIVEGLEDTCGERPDEALERKQLTEAAIRELMKLSRKHRDAFYYRSEQEYEWTKVAELLRCSVPTARSYYAKALESLKGVLE
jgi:hypothetical protein